MQRALTSNYVNADNLYSVKLTVSSCRSRELDHSPHYSQFIDVRAARDLRVGAYRIADAQPARRRRGSLTAWKLPLSAATIPRDSRFLRLIRTLCKSLDDRADTQLGLLPGLAYMDRLRPSARGAQTAPGTRHLITRHLISRKNGREERIGDN